MVERTAASECLYRKQQIQILIGTGLITMERKFLHVLKKSCFSLEEKIRLESPGNLMTRIRDSLDIYEAFQRDSRDHQKTGVRAIEGDYVTLG